MTIDFYYFPVSPPARSVLLLARTLNVKLNLKTVDLMKKEQLKKEYIEMNPQHTVPTLNDNGVVVWESRAIMSYLVDKYAKTDALNPKDPKKRAMVNQMMYFDIGTLNPRVGDYMMPLMTPGGQLDPAKLARVEEGLGFLNTSLATRSWVAGEQKTIADYNIAVTISTVAEMDVDMKKFPNIVKWMTKVKEDFIDYEELNGTQAKILAEYLKNMSKEKK